MSDSDGLIQNETGYPDDTQPRFAKQFLLAPSSYYHEQLNDWNVQIINNDHRVYSHPKLGLATATASRTHLWGLGMFLDPFDVEATDETILRRLAASSASFVELESNLAALGGRWVLISTIGTETRLYHDAAGQKSVFLCQPSSKETYVCSHPSLLHCLEITERDDELVARFEQYTNSGSWPVNIVPYRNVVQLLPNHYLNLDDSEMVRYWPRESLETRTLEEAAAAMLPILQGLVQAAGRRRQCAIGLSGGYDSRLLLASAEALWPELKVYTFRRNDSPHHDISIPKKISRRFPLNYSFVDLNRSTNTARASNSRLNRILQENVGGMYYDPALQATQVIWNVVGPRIQLPGLVSEVNRCFYYPNGEHPANMSPRDIARRVGFRDNPVAEDGVAVWLHDLPSGLPVELLDLFYWEHRLGVWAACGLTFREAIIDQVPPMNCRRFLELGLSTNVEARKAPYALVRRLIALAEPKLLNIPFNHDWVDDWHEFRLYKLPIPWRMKRALGWT